MAKKKVIKKNRVGRPKKAIEKHDAKELKEMLDSKLEDLDWSIEYHTKKLNEAFSMVAILKKLIAKEIS